MILSPVFISMNVPVPYVDFCLALREAGLPEQRRLLVAERGGHRHAVQDTALDRAVHLGGGADLGRISAGTSMDWRILSSHSMVWRFISMVREALVTSETCRPPIDAAGQVPDDPGVHGAEEDLAAFGARAAQALDVVEQPAGLRAGEAGRQRQARLAAEAVLADALRRAPAQAVGAGVLPDDRVVDRLTGVPVPQQRGLALVGDADRLDVGGGDAAFSMAPATTSWTFVQISWRRARPSPASGRSARAPSGRRRRCARRGRRRCSGWRWCPGRWPR